MAPIRTAVLRELGLTAVLLCLLASLCSAETTDVGQQAEKAFRKADFAAAKVAYAQSYAERGAINNTPGQQALNLHLLMQLGLCCHKLGQYEESRQWYGEVFAKFPNDRGECAWARYSTGLSYSRQGYRDLAIQNLEQVIKDYPEERGSQAYALLKIAKIRNRPGRYAEAIGTLQRIIKDYAGKRSICRQAKLVLVDAFDNDARITEAVDLLNELLASSEFDADEKCELLSKKANIQLYAGRYADSRTTCQQMLSGFTASRSAASSANWTLVQVMCEEATDPDGTLKLIDELRNEPAYRDVKFQAPLDLWTGFCYWAKKDYSKAEEQFSKVIDTYSDSESTTQEGLFHRGRLRAVALRSFDAALKDIEQLTTPYIQHFARGELYFSQEKYPDAVREYEQVVENLPPYRVMNTEPSLALVRLASCHSKLGDEARAEEAKKRLAEFESRFKDTRTAAVDKAGPAPTQ